MKVTIMRFFRSILINLKAYAARILFTLSLMLIVILPNTSVSEPQLLPYSQSLPRTAFATEREMISAVCHPPFALSERDTAFEMHHFFEPMIPALRFYRSDQACKVSNGREYCVTYIYTALQQFIKDPQLHAAIDHCYGALYTSDVVRRGSEVGIDHGDKEGSFVLETPDGRVEVRARKTGDNLMVRYIDR